MPSGLEAPPTSLRADRPLGPSVRLWLDLAVALANRLHPTPLLPATGVLPCSGPFLRPSGSWWGVAAMGARLDATI